MLIPAKAGIHPLGRTPWTPAFAGVTKQAGFKLDEAEH
jgi:hypothetical protein